jgi:flagellar hook-basal body complex protein FliE
MIVPPLGAGAELGLSQLEGASAGSQSTGGSAAIAGGEGVSFGGELTDAISSLEKTQESGDSAAQALATGTVKDPESAVTTVEDAQMAMELAAQIRTKATESVQNIFQTQV